MPESLGIAGLGWGWLVLGATTASCLVVMITVRPRPAYVLVLGFTLQALVAACALVLAAKSRAGEHLAALVPVVAIGAIFLVPRVYDADYDNVFGFRGRPLLTDYRRLAALRDRFADRRARVVAPRFAYALGVYVGVAGESFVEFEPWIRGKPHDVDLADWLSEQKITHVYADGGLLADPRCRSFFARAESLGWRRRAGDTQWALLERVDGTGTR